jgi:hypothetical protein
MYALSSLLKHNAKAVKEMSKHGGWDVLRAALEGWSFILGLVDYPPSDCKPSQIPT